MPPSTTSPQITAEGRAAAGRIAEFRENLNNGATTAQARRNVRAVTNPGMATSATPGQITPPTTQINRTGFRVQTPDTFAVETATGAPTRNEVLDRRAQMEQEQTMRTNLTQGYDALMGRIGTVSSPFVNPEETINRLLLNRPTETQTALDEARAGQARTTRGFVGGLEQAGEQAREEFGVADLQSSLAETRNRIAERTNQLRTTLRDFETNAKRRGFAREFVDAEKRKVQADAAAELADLAIIESAQLGNLTEARNEIDRVLDQKIQAYQFENQAIEQEIARLQAMDTREGDARSEQLQIALQERNRQIEQTIANERETRDYMAQAAANGADSGTLDAIRKAATPGEAALLAGPWIGRMDRMVQQANIAQGWEGLNLRRQELELSRQRLVSEANAYGTIDGKPQTAAQAQVAGFANRLLEAEGVLRVVGDQFAARSAVFGEALGSTPLLGNLVKSPERQQFEQARRNFINSVLRRESGAVIGKEEFANAEEQYFAKPGDSPEVLAQKAANRNTAINNLYRESNLLRPVLAGDIVESNGQKYQVGEDGVTLIEI